MGRHSQRTKDADRGNEIWLGIDGNMNVWYITGVDGDKYILESLDGTDTLWVEQSLVTVYTRGSDLR